MQTAFSEAAARLKFSKIVRDVRITIYNELGEHAELRCGLGPAPTARLYKHSGARHTRCFRKFPPPIENQIKFRENIKYTMSHDFVTHIQGSRLQLRISTFGLLYSWEHETYFHF